ncbi:36675_t:CDS:2 [Gigaspora margarita]|uniref:36675_t:CDS:1 n=1 Tax=Gigaspora margarita TaxID=4874 RepID=A0ABN7UTR0_GIGMA|nr:36675_t:CDS:2 [Gigaspora margarita]
MFRRVAKNYRFISYDISCYYSYRYYHNPSTSSKQRFNDHDVVYDFRSDTVTTPTQQMFEAMVKASKGDDVYGEDKSTNDLESYVAKLTGHEAALFTISGTMANQLALLSHLSYPPYSIICDHRTHSYAHEAGGISFHSRASVTPLIPMNKTHITLSEIQSSIIPDTNIHNAPTRVISLENTLKGLIFPIKELYKISEFARNEGLKIHLDGARLWNASAETGIEMKQYGKLFDSMSLCFSKGLGAPIGSIIVGNMEFIKRARHLRKLFGGGWRQSGLLAAAAKFALETNYPNRLKETHILARELASGLSKLGIRIVNPVHTNMVFIDTSETKIGSTDALAEKLGEHGIKISGDASTLTRLVVHYQIEKNAVERFINVVSEIC